MPPCAGVPVLIPAFKPGDTLPEVVRNLLDLGVPAVIVVNDGSGPEYAACFQKIGAWDRVQVVHHAVNLGKGAALKTGLNHALVQFPGCCGVVTADADGQHHPDDILRVSHTLMKNPEVLVMGVRAFAGDVPLRSRVGNGATRVLMRLMVGLKLSDTQTGLRGIPSKLIPDLLRLPSRGYEFELDMLIACKHQGCPLVEEPIRTIYLDGNKSSHFHPVFDSMRIYFLLFRFSILSLLTAGLDNLVFALVVRATGSIGESMVTARLAAMIFNYSGARRVVFQSRQRQVVVLPKYVLLVVCNGLLSYVLIRFLQYTFGFHAIPAKLLAEGLLFIVSFTIQRDFVFTKREPVRTPTDWDQYHAKVPAVARLTRRYTARVMLHAIRRYVAPSAPGEQLAVVEIGGGNSCFLDSITAAMPCRSYDVVDPSPYGLSLLAKRVGTNSVVRLHERSVLEFAPEESADLVFSVGLVQYFDRATTLQAVRAHFDALRPGGIAILTFPTPTLLYRFSRGFLELIGKWRFHDERPLDPSEVREALGGSGEVLVQKTLWPLVLTQELIVAKKVAQPASPVLTPLKAHARAEL